MTTGSLSRRLARIEADRPPAACRECRGDLGVQFVFHDEFDRALEAVKACAACGRGPDTVINIDPVNPRPLPEGT
jgi:hypothetical protein